MTVPIRIFGIGSPFGGDSIGLQAAQKLTGCFPDYCVSVEGLDRPGIGLIRAMEGARVAILMDAVMTGAPVGSLVRIERDRISRVMARHTSTHGFGIAEALLLAEKLNQLPERLVLIGVEISSKNDGLNAGVVDALTEEVRREAGKEMDKLGIRSTDSVYLDQGR
jgi:hydrogenase maturation protease